MVSRHCPSCLSTISSMSLLRRPSSVLPPAFLLPFQTSVRYATSKSDNKPKKKDEATQKRKKTRTTFRTHDLKDVLQFPLVDAMRYLRAAEVGRPLTQAKYELHIKLSTLKNGPVVRNRLRLPHPVRTDLRICVICPPDSLQAKQATAAGATLVGEDTIFESVKAGNIEFDRCICHQDSLPKLTKAGLGRMLGPRGLMPSTKTGTVVKDVAASVREMVGASEYRERVGVVRMAVGQLGFAPEELQRNIRAFVEAVKRDIALLSDKISKDVHEVVLSSTNGPGFSLNGELRGPNSVPNSDVGAI